MRPRLFSIVLLIFIVGIQACSSKIELKNVDLDNWKKDRNGCLGLRAQEVDDFKAVKDDILGKDNQALIKTFGRPDRVELANRSQSFYIYYFEPSTDCEGVAKNAEPLMAIIRLNALSRVSEVTVSTLDPGRPENEP
ncbi:hypothetical protein C943_01219 [Mariniradius saccharolyticus AK6]|uniref:Lipoprotein n=2 Tax=Mariniradius TaxID=1245590 RepID=M7XVH7_9BACT|nr:MULTISPECIES: hypothetical protein [Mariniradius]EMS32492.1 hypothetical protein C943_01219 [Mariniradius saccharolyticus AK6]MCF1752677.1 hypothetical protein [Mariniradius sediminis]